MTLLRHWERLIFYVSILPCCEVVLPSTSCILPRLELEWMHFLILSQACFHIFASFFDLISHFHFQTDRVELHHQYNMYNERNMDGNIIERGVELVENDNQNQEHIALVVVTPPEGNNKISKWREMEDQEFIAIMTRHIFRGEEDRRRFEECSIRTMDDLRMINISDMTVLFPAPRDFMIRRRLGYIIEYLKKYGAAMEKNQSLQLQDMTMQMIIDSLCHPRKRKHWCFILLDLPILFLFILWLIILCVTGYFLTRGQ